MKRKALLSLSLAFSLLAPSSVEACSICMTAIADFLLPPILVWAAVAILLFLIASLVSGFTRSKVPGIPSFGYALLVALGFLVVGAMFLGLGTPVLLLIPVILMTAKTLRMRIGNGARPSVPHLWLAYANLAVLTCLVAFSAHAHIVRPPADFILKWQGTGPGGAALNRLCSRGPSALPDLRTVAVGGAPTTAAQAAEAIAQHGTDEVDVPILIRSLENANGDPYATPMIEEALRLLSGIDLPEGSTPQEWRRQWAEHKETHRSSDS